MRARRILLSCEHGGNRIPRRYATYFRGAHTALMSHRGYDAGALWLARWLSQRWDVPLIVATTSRLLIDLNRSLHHQQLFSHYSRALTPEKKANAVREIYQPHRKGVETAVARWIARGDSVLHIAVHSFVPVLSGVRRRTDIGLLYDPRRRGERAFCRRWQRSLVGITGQWNIRCNAPYRGTTDGLTTALRRCFGPAAYWGVELEVNQRHLKTRAATQRLARMLADSLPRFRPL